VFSLSLSFFFFPFGVAISSYFKGKNKWSLLSFLKHRREDPDFTGDKAKEHLKYKNALKHIANSGGSESSQAKGCLINFEVLCSFFFYC
jgi:hypothetical protein